MVCPISFSFLFKACMFADKEVLKEVLRLTCTPIFQANIQNIIQRIIFTEMLQDISKLIFKLMPYFND